MSNRVTVTSPATAALQVVFPVFQVKKSQFLIHINLHLIATKAKTKQKRPKLKYSKRKKIKNVKYK